MGAAAQAHKIGFYYSLIDWHRPNFPIDIVHKYRQYMNDQVTELLSNYGKIDIIWYDFSYPRYRNGKSSEDLDSKFRSLNSSSSEGRAEVRWCRQSQPHSVSSSSDVKNPFASFSTKRR